MVTDELQSFEDESEPERTPNPEYANVAITEDDNIQEPSTYEEASQREEWRKAMEEEIQPLKHNQTWDLVPRPKDLNPISSKRVYKVKTCADGSVER